MDNLQVRKFSMCRLIGLTGVFVILVGTIMAGSGAWMFINIPCIVITLGITFFLLLATFGKDFLRFIPDSLLTLVSTPAKPNPRFAEIASLGGRYVIASGLIALMIGIIQMLSNLSDPDGIGVGMAVAMTSPFYAIITSEIFFAYCHKSYSGESKPQVDSPVSLRNIGLSSAVVGFILVQFAFLMISFAEFS